MNTKTHKFSFIAENLPANTFKVVNFQADDGISSPYFLDITLLTEKQNIDMQDLTVGNTRFITRYRNMKLYYQGLVYRFEYLYQAQGYFFYKAMLAPRLWALSMSRHSQVFLDKTVPEILEQVLIESGMLSGRDVEFRLTTNYPRREYVCQYNESPFDFFSRWCEREGMYYYFEQDDHGEKLIVTDNLVAHEHLPRQPVLRYRSVSGLDTKVRGQIATRFVRQQYLVPGSVRLRDYNYRHASVNLDSGEKTVDQNGVGNVYLFGNNLKSMDEARHIANVRAEEARSKQIIYKGEGRAPFLRPGFTCTMEDHPRPEINADYLIINTKITGDQRLYLTSGLALPLLYDENIPDFHIKFTAIPASVQFRPKRATNVPHFYGCMNAVVESEGDGKYAHLDEQGRYKVRLPFDTTEAPKGRASGWVRMAQPYAGAGHGLHFPLLNGTEVLLTFIEGDIDRPVIAAALHNGESPSLVSSKNAPANAIRSASGNQLVMGDKEGQEFVGLFSPHAQSGISIGSHKPGGGGSIAIATKGVFDEFTAGGSISCNLGAETSLVVGISDEVFAGLKSSVELGMSMEFSFANSIGFNRGDRIELGTESKDLMADIALIGLDEVEISGGTEKKAKGLISRARIALGVGVAGSVAAGIGVAMISRPFDKEFLEEAKLEWHKSKGLGAGIPLLGLGAAAALASGILTTKIVNAYDNSSKNLRTSNMTFSKEGIQGTVNSKVSGTAAIKLEVDKKGPLSSDAEKSVIQIGTMGQSISLTNKEKADFKMENGNEITASVMDRNNKSFSLKLTDQRISLDANDGGALVLTDDLALLCYSMSSQTNASQGRFTASSNEAIMKCGQSNKINIKDSGVTITTSEGIMTSTGELTFSGSKINIG